MDEPRPSKSVEEPARRTEAEIDEALDESFPASDPPPWNPGVVKERPPAPAKSAGSQVDGDDAGEAPLTRRPTRP